MLDLGFFRAIQSFNDAVLKNKEELIQAVSVAYDNYPQEKLNHTWLTLQSCFNWIILNYGDNDYNIEHISKEKLENKWGSCQMYWMWWRKWQHCITSTPPPPPNNLNDEMDDAEMETNITAKEVEENTNTDDMNHPLGDVKECKGTHKTKGLPILPTHKWEDGGYSQ